MLSEISQTEKDKYCVIFYMLNPKKKKKAKFIEIESSMVATRGGWGRWGDAGQRLVSPVVRWESADLIYTTVTLVNNTMLCI